MRCFLYAFYSLPTLLVFPLSPPYVDFLSSTSRGQFDVQVNHACVIFRNQIKLKILKGKQRSVLNGNVHNALEHVRFCFFFFFLWQALYAAAALLDFGTILYSSTQQAFVP